jgi:putative membrane protein
MTAWLLATLHLVALGLGLGAGWVRARAFDGGSSGVSLRRALAADSVWGIAALLWISTGLLRAFGGYEKGTAYYLQSDAFLAKMGLLAAILLLEIWPMATLVGVRVRRATSIDAARARAFARISEMQAVLVVAMVFLATAMARGLGF